jgi:type I restriction enzyme S subunit
MSWEMVKLDDCLEWITYGFTNPMPDADNGPWKVTAKDIIDGRINFDSARHTTQEAYEKDLTDKSRPIKDDLLLTKDGTLGRVALVGEETICINQSVALLRLKKDIIAPEYLLYLLQSSEYQGKMLADAGGSTIKHIYITKVNQMQIPLPPPETQRKLVDILQAYDKILDINQKQIKLLEEAAQRL